MRGPETQITSLAELGARQALIDQTDHQDEQRILHQAQLIKNGAHIINGVLRITDIQHRKLRTERPTPAKIEITRSAEVDPDEDYPVTINDFDEFVEVIGHKALIGEVQPNWSPSYSAGTATRVWNKLLQGGQNLPNGMPNAYHDGLNPLEKLGLSVFKTDDEPAVPGTVPHALSGKSLERAMATGTIENADNGYKLGQRSLAFLSDFVTQQIAERKQAADLTDQETLDARG